MEAIWQPFEVRLQITQEQILTVQGRRWITTMHSVFFDPIGIQENQSGRICAVIPTSPVLFHRVFNDLETISSTADTHVEMDMQISRRSAARP